MNIGLWEIVLRDVHWIIGLFYLDRINWIVWIVFLLCQIPDEAGRKQSAEIGQK